MRKIIFCLVFACIALPVFAARDPLAGIRSALTAQDYMQVNKLARELLNERLSRGQTQETEYCLALSHLRLGEYPAAGELFRKLLSERPSVAIYDKASIGLIEALQMQGQYEQALQEALNLIGRRKDSDMLPMMYLKAARANLKLARWGRARDFLQKIIAEFPRSFEAEAARALLEEKQYFAVQVGSFNDKSRAEALMKELIEKKEYAYIIEMKSAEGRTYYRVRAGQLTTLKDARDLEKKLSGFGYPTLIYP